MLFLFLVAFEASGLSDSQHTQPIPCCSNVRHHSHDLLLIQPPDAWTLSVTLVLKPALDLSSVCGADVAQCTEAASSSAIHPYYKATEQHANRRHWSASEMK